jgi:hypothetical protein
MSTTSTKPEEASGSRKAREEAKPPSPGSSVIVETRGGRAPCHLLWLRCLGHLLVAGTMEKRKVEPPPKRLAMACTPTRGPPPMPCIPRRFGHRHAVAFQAPLAASRASPPKPLMACVPTRGLAPTPCLCADLVAATSRELAIARVPPPKHHHHREKRRKGEREGKERRKRDVCYVVLGLGLIYFRL